ncbi:hypothetical protein ACWGTO_30425 [Mesorhizobium sp. PL10]
MVQIDRGQRSGGARGNFMAMQSRASPTIRKSIRFLSARARRTADVASQYGVRRDSEHAQYFSCQLGNKGVGLVRAEAGFSMTDFESETWREQIPGRAEIASIVGLQVTHPHVENAGDILWDHQLRSTVAELACGESRSTSPRNNDVVCCSG